MNIFTFSQLEQLIKKINNKKVVVVGGCFDLLHLGHIIFLQKAKEQGEIVIVLLESDQTIKKLKGDRRPIHTQEVRSQILAELKSVDFVLVLPPMKSNHEYDQLIEKLSPRVIATTEGDEYDFHKKRQAEKTGAKLVYVTKQINEHSTTQLIQKLSRE